MLAISWRAASRGGSTSRCGGVGIVRRCGGRKRYQTMADTRTCKNCSGTWKSLYSNYVGVLPQCSAMSRHAWNPNTIKELCTPMEDRSRTTTAVTPLACSSIHNKDVQIAILRRLAHRLRLWVRRLWEMWIVSLRSTEIALRLSPLLVLTPAAVMTSSSRFFSSHDNNKDDTHNPVSKFAWWYTLKQIHALGPCFVKLAQWIATRRDLFSPNVCNHFGKLHDNGFTHSWSHTHKALTEAFGPNYRERGLHVNQNDVIGSGSAAQVYKGRLVLGNDEDENVVSRPVAIKVLHPRFAEWIESDLQFMESVAHLLHNLPFLRNYVMYVNLPQVAQNFGQLLRLQADLRVEGDNLTRFRENFGADDKRHPEEQKKNTSFISFPQPVEGWIHRNVLVQELVDGCKPIAEYLHDESDEGHKIRRELAGPLLRAFLKMVFLDNFVHCDLHPGNVFVQTKPLDHSSSKGQESNWFSNYLTNQGEPQNEAGAVERKIVFIDTGIAMSLTSNDKKNLRDLFKAIVLNNGDEAGRLMVSRAKFECCSDTPGCVDSFAHGVEDIVKEFHDRRKQGLTLGAVRVGALLNRVLDLCRTHAVEVDPSMANIVISTLVLEGLGRSLEPELNLMDFAIPFVFGRGKV